MKSKPLARLDIKKIKAFPKDFQDEDYITQECYICEDEYLVQDGMIQKEIGKCPECKDKHLCYSCEEPYDIKSMTETGDCEFECEYCYQPTCIACNNEVEEEGMCCSKECIGVMRWDNRDKMI